MAGDVLAVAGVAAGAHAALGRLQGARVGLEPGTVDDEAHGAALGDLPPVAGEPVPGHVGDGVDIGPERDERLGRRAVQPPHVVDGDALVVGLTRGERQARAERLRQQHDVTGPGARLAQHAVGVDDALHGEPEDGFRVADRVAACHRAPGLGDDDRRGVEDRRHRPTGEVLGEGGDVDRQHHPAAHGEHVAAGVGRGDGAVVAGVVDQRREEVGRRDERRVLVDPVDRCVVEGRQARRAAPGRPRGQVTDQLGQHRGAPLRRAPPARRPLGQSQRVWSWTSGIESSVVAVTAPRLGGRRPPQRLALGRAGRP